jgi:hypothetical protein
MVAAVGVIDYHVHTPESRVSTPAANVLAGRSSFERRVADTR